MKKHVFFTIVILFVMVISACGHSPAAKPVNAPTPQIIQTSEADDTPQPVSASRPCIGAPAPKDGWHHIVVLMFENKKYDEVIGPAPYITGLAKDCATAPNWMDAETRVDGTKDGQYNSKPNYATLTSGVSPSVHGLTTGKYETTTGVENIYHQMAQTGISFKDYYDGDPGGCSVRFNGDYHDPIRYYTNVAGICDAHDVPLSMFQTDFGNGSLPAFSFILFTKENSMHDNSITSGDAYARTILEPLLNSKEYANGDMAIFLLWDEMLGLPLLGDTSAAPSLLPYFGDDGPLQ
jgi:phospholipase C